MTGVWLNKGIKITQSDSALNMDKDMICEFHINKQIKIYRTAQKGIIVYQTQK